MNTSSQHISILGAGLMGRSIAVEFAVHGFTVDLITRRHEDAFPLITSQIAKLIEKFYPEKAEAITASIHLTTDHTSFKDSVLILESIAEDLSEKHHLMELIRDEVPLDTLVASNTSSLSIGAIFADFPNPARCFGMHFFNPVQVMKLVELSHTPLTSAETLARAKALIAAVEKEEVLVKDSPGFIVNRLLFPLINEAAKMVEDGIATIDDIDKAMKLGANHPIGPFKLSDIVGTDITLHILEQLEKSNVLDERPITSSIKSMVDENKLGRKTGLGFYDYTKK
jgi:3-hydroxybutyryl-CoA dehydrogenase